MWLHAPVITIMFEGADVAISSDASSRLCIQNVRIGGERWYRCSDPNSDLKVLTTLVNKINYAFWQPVPTIDVGWIKDRYTYVRK